MVAPKQIFDLLQANGISLFTGVPDSLLKEFCAYVTDHTDERSHIIAANEGAAVGIAAGHYLASSKPALVYMQNSGIGNAVNPLLSLVDEKVYKIPMLLVVGWRGEPGVKDEPQHLKQGEVTLALFDTMQIQYTIIDSNDEKAIRQFKDILTEINEKGVLHAAIIRKNIFASYKLQKSSVNYYEMSREEVLKVVVDALMPDDLVVSTTGKLSRELFEYREFKHEGHDKDFLTVGSMGHSSSIAFGIALNKPDRTVFCLDGDGAMIMHMGALSSIGTTGLKNFKHIVFNNGVHESVGGQPTVGFKINLADIAKANGYKAAYMIETKEELNNIVRQIQYEDGPIFVEIKVNTQSREDLGRPTTTTMENKVDFMKNILAK